MVQKVHEVMTSPAVTVDKQAGLAEAARLMRDRDIVVRAAAEARDMSTTPVEDVCSHHVDDVNVNDDADQAVKLMRARSVRRVPVTDGDRLVGVVALSDMAVERDGHSALADISVATPNR